MAQPPGQRAALLGHWREWEHVAVGQSKGPLGVLARMQSTTAGTNLPCHVQHSNTLWYLLGAAFLKKHKTELCSRMGQLSSILLNLSVEDVINSEEEEEVQAQNTKQKKNQFLLDLVEKKGLKAQEKLFQVLQTKDPFLVEDLENN